MVHQTILLNNYSSISFYLQDYIFSFLSLSTFSRFERMNSKNNVKEDNNLYKKFDGFNKYLRVIINLFQNEKYF